VDFFQTPAGLQPLQRAVEHIAQVHVPAADGYRVVLVQHRLVNQAHPLPSRAAQAIQHAHHTLHLTVRQRVERRALGEERTHVEAHAAALAPGVQSALAAAADLDGDRLPGQVAQRDIRRSCEHDHALGVSVVRVGEVHQALAVAGVNLLADKHIYLAAEQHIERVVARYLGEFQLDP